MSENPDRDHPTGIAEARALVQGDIHRKSHRCRGARARTVGPPMFQQTITTASPQRGLHDITQPVAAVVTESGIVRGMCNLFVRHTSASLTIQENADPDVRRDLEAFFRRMVPDGDTLFRHTMEGPDDMPAHICAALTSTSLVVPIVDGKLALGTWQGIYLWEHRRRCRDRSILVTVWGERGWG